MSLVLTFTFNILLGYRDEFLNLNFEKVFSSKKKKKSKKEKNGTHKNII